MSLVGLEWYLTALLMRICRVCQGLDGLEVALGRHSDAYVSRFPRVWKVWSGA
jgi:hypothetical protein